MVWARYKRWVYWIAVHDIEVGWIYGMDMWDGRLRSSCDTPKSICRIIGKETGLFQEQCTLACGSFLPENC